MRFCLPVELFYRTQYLEKFIGIIIKNSNMVDFEQIHLIYKLKEVERKGTVSSKRYESAAEHVYSSLILARYFLKKIDGLDEKRVMDMLLYHDVVEVYAGDTFILDEKLLNTKKEREQNASTKLVTNLPSELSVEFKYAFLEFEEGKTKEAKFCKAIDALDPIMHSLHKPAEWKDHGFTERKIRDKKEHLFKEFPIMLDFFNDLIQYLKRENTIPES
jgi:putative hydrolase of HD superfamily